MDGGRADTHTPTMRAGGMGDCAQGHTGRECWSDGDGRDCERFG